MSQQQHSEFGTHLLTTAQVADLLGLSLRTLEDWRLRGGGPKFVRMSGRCVRYRPSAVERWIDAREVASTADNGNIKV